MVKEQQTERMGIRLTPAEAKMLEALSEATGLTMSNVVRQAIREKYAQRFGEPPVTKAKKPKR